MSILDEMKLSVTKQFDEIQVPEEVDQRVKQSFIEFHAKKEKKKMKKKMVAFGLAVAVILPTGVYALSGSYFADKNVNLNGLVDSGVKNAVSKGLSVPIDQKITDQGITIHFKEMYVEDSRILVHYKIEKQDGSLVPFEFDTTGLHVLSDGKKNGQQVENPLYKEPQYEGFSVLNFIGAEEDKLPFYLTDSAGNELDTGVADKDEPEGILAFVTSGSPLPQSIYMNVNINRIGKTKGSWKGQFPIDQSKAKEATKTAR